MLRIIVTNLACRCSRQVAEAEIALGYCELRAPFDGWGLKRNVDVGTLVGPATNGFTLADTRSVKAVFGVPDTAMGQVKLGSPPSITTEALPGSFSGHITSISAAADAKSRVYSVEVRIDNQDNRLKAGMIATIAIGAVPPNARVLALFPLAMHGEPLWQPLCYSGDVHHAADGAGFLLDCRARSEVVDVGRTT